MKVLWGRQEIVCQQWVELVTAYLEGALPRRLARPSIVTSPRASTAPSTWPRCGSPSASLGTCLSTTCRRRDRCVHGGLPRVPLRRARRPDADARERCESVTFDTRSSDATTSWRCFSVPWRGPPADTGRGPGQRRPGHRQVHAARRGGARLAGTPLYLGRCVHVGGEAIPLAPLIDLIRQVRRGSDGSRLHALESLGELATSGSGRVVDVFTLALEPYRQLGLEGPVIVGSTISTGVTPRRGSFRARGPEPGRRAGGARRRLPHRRGRP